MTPQTETAFVHVDLDDVWAIADCYGFDVSEEAAHLVYASALKRFQELFSRLGITATFFVVGRDLEFRWKAERLRELKKDGHAFANHSYSHHLAMRDLSSSEIESEVSRTHEIIRSEVGYKARGFRAPGYGASARLVDVLGKLGYAYDSSIMPSPFGFVFRSLDKKLARLGKPDTRRKTQYPLMADARASLRPYHVSSRDIRRETPDAPLLELPVATSPLFRLPFQAGVCMRLGRMYFRYGLSAFRRAPGLPLLFLVHGADLVDFRSAGHPVLSRSGFFATPAEDKERELEFYLRSIQEHYRILLLEDTLRQSGGEGVFSPTRG